MTTKRTLILVLISGLMFLVTTSSAQEPSWLKFTDGYFTSNYGPVHLAHDKVDLRISLGNEYHLRLSFEVNVGVSNPCSRREEKECLLIQQVVVRGADGKEEFVAGWKTGLGFSVGAEKMGGDGESVGFGIPLITIPRTSPTKNTFLVVKIVKEDQEVYRKEWPIQIY